MIPYPEPYHSQFQRRRLGALGIEWRPSLIKYAIGPDFSVGQDYQVIPLADLEGVLDPQPEFLEALLWEPEYDIVSDDNDSEYNVKEDNSSAAEQGTISAISSSDIEYSESDSNNKDGLRRSRRKSHDIVVERMTSGRRVRKRNLGEYLGVNDDWIDVIASQESFLLAVDVSGSNVTDSGLRLLKNCSNIQALTLNYCDQFSEHRLKHINGLSNLTSLSTRKSCVVTPDGMRTFSNLVNLEKLDLEWCSYIHGGFVHFKGMKKFESLNIGCCKCITDSNMKAISGFINLKELQISNNNVTDLGISYLRGLQKLATLNVEGCNIIVAYFEYILALAALACLNLNRCGLSDDGFEKFSGLTSLNDKILGFPKEIECYLSTTSSNKVSSHDPATS